MSNAERKFAVTSSQTLNSAIRKAVTNSRASGIPIYYAENVTSALLPGPHRMRHNRRGTLRQRPKRQRSAAPSEVNPPKR